jgi:hypothetical protein
LSKYIYNEHFVCQKGEEYFVEGRIRFPEEPLLSRFKGGFRADGTYRTAFGPSVPTTAKIYRDSNLSVSQAMTRLTAVRKDDPVLEQRLSENQVKFVDNHRELYDKLAGLYANAFREYQGLQEEARLYHADPHPKRELRIAAWDELIERGRLGEPLWLKYTTYKLKKAEWAKNDKIARMIGDLKVPASLQGFRVTKLLKQAMEENDLHINGGVISFCAKPSTAALDSVFERLDNPPGRFFIVYFSDDACAAIRQPDGHVFRANLDISKCDASHGPSIFESITTITGNDVANEDITTLVNQCKTPIRVYDKATRKRYVQLAPTRPKLYSGSTLTTCVNNFANINIGVAISEIPVGTYISSQTITKAVEQTGYIMTVVECEMFEDLQFLKHSPVLDKDGVWRPLLNIGVLLRLSGVCKGDLPGSGPLEPRARAFQKALLAGAVPRSSYPLIDAMKRTVADATRLKRQDIVEKAVANLLEYKLDDSNIDEPVRYFRAADVYRRYRLEDWEIENLDSTFGRATYGHVYGSSGASKILKKDYELECHYS